MANNQYPTFSTRIPNEPKEYPTLDQAQINESVDLRYDAQGSKIQNQPLQKGLNDLHDSNNPMYDVQYDSESAKKYTQPMQNIPNQPNYMPNNVNAPNYNQFNNSSLDEKYDSDKAKIYHQPIPGDELKVPNESYNSQNYRKDKHLDTQYDSSPLATAQYSKANPQPAYKMVPPHGPGMFPHFPHHSHFPHHPKFPHYPPGQYPYEGNYYAYC